MHDLVLSPRQLGFVIGTRAAGAFGIGLLVANRIPERRRRNIGLTLLALGLATTVPAAKFVFGKRASETRASQPRQTDVAMVRAPLT